MPRDPRKHQKALMKKRSKQKAAAQHYLPAEFNLAVVQMETGDNSEGTAGLQRYLRSERRRRPGRRADRDHVLLHPGVHRFAAADIALVPLRMREL